MSPQLLENCRCITYIGPCELLPRKKLHPTYMQVAYVWEPSLRENSRYSFCCCSTCQLVKRGGAHFLSPFPGHPGWSSDDGGFCWEDYIQTAMQQKIKKKKREEKKPRQQESLFNLAFVVFVFLFFFPFCVYLIMNVSCFFEYFYFAFFFF